MPLPREKRSLSALPAYAALATLALLATALVRRRWKLGYVLLHVAVALGEKWRDQRAMARVGEVLATMPADALHPEEWHPEDGPRRRMP